MVLLGLLCWGGHPSRGWSEESPTTAAKPLPVAVPIVQAGGRVMVTAKVNGSRPLSLLLDTGYGISMIHPDLVQLCYVMI